MNRPTLFTIIAVLVLAIGVYFLLSGEADLEQAPLDNEEVEIPFELIPQGM